MDQSQTAEMGMSDNPLPNWDMTNGTSGWTGAIESQDAT
jgi:hypothetical protein